VYKLISSQLTIIFFLLATTLWGNNICSESIEIEINEYPTYDNWILGEYSNYTLSSDSTLCSDFSIHNYTDIWFTFIATNEQLLIRNQNSNMELFAGENCENLEFIKCIPTTQEITDCFEIDKRYYVRSIGWLQSSFQYNVNNAPATIYDTSCDDAHVISPNEVQSHDFIGVSNDLPESSSECINSQGADIWYKFFSETSFYSFTFFSFETDFFNSQIEVFKGNCGASESVYCNDLSSMSNEKFYVPFEIGEWYYIRLSTRASSILKATPFTFSIKTSFGSSNDFCNNATVISTSHNLSSCKSFDEFNTSTDNTIDLPPCWNESQKHDSWFKFIAKNTSYQLVTDEESNLAFYQGSCDNLELLNCGNEIYLESLTIDQEYLIRTTGKGELCLHPSIVNDECIEAITLIPLEFNTPSSYPMIGASLSNITCDETDNRDIWFNFDATTTSVISLPSSQTGITLSLYEGECDNLTLVDCFTNAGYFYYRIDSLNIGQTYHLKYATSIADQLNITLISVPQNERLNHAINLPVDTCFNASFHFVSKDLSTNYEDELKRGLWYKFIPESDVYDIIFDNETELEIFNIDAAGDLSLYTRYRKPNAFSTYTSKIHFEIGETYIFKGWSDEDEFKLCIEEYEPIDNYSWLTPREIEIDTFGSFASNHIAYFDLVCNLWESDTLSCVTDKYFSDAWYFFVATDSSLIIDARNAVMNFQLYEKHSSDQMYLECPIFEETISYIGNGSRVNDLKIGNSYLLRLHNENEIAFQTSNFLFNLTSLPRNANDNLENIIEIEVQPPFGCVYLENSFFHGLNHPTASNHFAEICDTSHLLDNDVWFSFIATDTMLQLYFSPFLGASSYLNYELYTNENDLLTCHQSIQPALFGQGTTSIFNNLIIGKEYYIRFPETVGSIQENNLFAINFCVQEFPIPPINNGFDKAIELVSSENLTECNPIDSLTINLISNSVWLKFTASSENHQLLTYSEQISLDSRLYFMDDNNELFLKSTHAFLEVFNNPPFTSNYDFQTAIISNDEIAVILSNYTALEVGTEYFIELRFPLENNGDLNNYIALNPVTYSACLKTIPEIPTNNNFTSAKYVAVNNGPQISEYGYTTMSFADYDNYPHSNNCPAPSPSFKLEYPEVWYYFEAEQNSHHIHIENQTTFSDNLNQIENFPAFSNEYNLEAKITIYHESGDGDLIPIHCDIDVDSFFTVENLIINDKYYIKVHYDCLNYITDLNFGISISSFLDEDMDGFLSNIDCDDTNPEINPDSDEVVYNGIDDDCNPNTLDDDLDMDGFLLSEDCNDLNVNINPEAEEIVYNGLNDDCNTDTLDDDLDMDGYLVINDCDDYNANINPGAIEIPNNDIDEDCDGDDLVTSIEELREGLINLYPNPARDVIYIESNTNQKYEICMYNLLGEKVITSNNATHIPINQLIEGVYLIEIVLSDHLEKVIKRIIVRQ